VAQLQVMWVYAQLFLARTRQDERGMTTLEKVVLTAIAVAMALAAGTIIYNLAVNKAGEIDPTFTP
jgi:cell division protein FtsL